jgi:hypothetical protein
VQQVLSTLFVTDGHDALHDCGTEVEELLVLVESASKATVGTHLVVDETYEQCEENGV